MDNKADVLTDNLSPDSDDRALLAYRPIGADFHELLF